MKQYKFQGLVALHPAAGQPCPTLGPAPSRMVLRGQDAQTGRCQLFTALVSCDENQRFRPGDERRLVTLRIVDDDVTDFLEAGRHFALWLGTDIGEGVVTRRLFI